LEVGDRLEVRRVNKVPEQLEIDNNGEEFLENDESLGKFIKMKML